MKYTYIMLIFNAILLSTASKGAEKLILSKHGYEGFAKDGLWISVHKHKGQDDKDIKIQFETKPKKAGIRINAKSRDHLFINADPIKIKGKVVKYFILFLPTRDVQFTGRNREKYTYPANVRASAIKTDESGLKAGLDTIINGFISDYFAANPRK